MARPEKRGVWESHSFCVISAPAVLSILVCGSLPCCQKAQGVMAAAKSPYSGYRALSRIASPGRATRRKSW